ncbi:MAG: class I SAM-dependent methyltransferase [Anaerolineae bacterium]
MLRKARDVAVEPIRRIERTHKDFQYKMRLAKLAQDELLIKYSTTGLLAKQYRGEYFNRMDVIVRYLAIEHYFGYNNYGFALYRKMQWRRVNRNTEQSFRWFIQSVEENGLNGNSPIEVDWELNLQDGSHRLALALYFGIHEVPLKIASERMDVDYGLQWFRANGFSEREVTLIRDKQIELFARYGLPYLVSEELRRLHAAIMDILRSEKQDFGRGELYQSCEDLGLSGQRPTRLRFERYGLGELLNGSLRVLDIGCNCGFLSLLCAKYARQVDGIDVNESMIRIAELTRQFLGVSKCDFFNASFSEFIPDDQYDVVLSLAVHHWIGMPMKVYGERLYQILKPGGFLVFESQDLNTVDQDFQTKLDALVGIGFRELRSGILCDDGRVMRKYVVLQKENQC